MADIQKNVFLMNTFKSGMATALNMLTCYVCFSNKEKEQGLKDRPRVGNDLQTTGRNWDQYEMDPGGRHSLWSKKNNDTDN